MEEQWKIDEEELRALDLTLFNEGRDPYPPGDPSLGRTFARPASFYRETIRDTVGATGGRVLDLLCGAGRWAVFLAEQNTEVVGVDRLEGCVRIARGLCRHFGLDNTRFHAGDISWVETLPDGYFDTVWMYSALQYVNRAYALSQAHRLLRPGGLLFVGNYNARGLMLQHFLKGVQSGAVNEGASQWALEALVRGEEADGNPSYTSLEGAAGLCERFGFSLEVVRPEAEFYPSGSRKREGGRRRPAPEDAAAVLASAHVPVVSLVARRASIDVQARVAAAVSAVIERGRVVPGDASIVQLRPEAATAALVSRLGDRDQHVQQAARWILVEAGEHTLPELVRRLKSARGSVRGNLETALREIAVRRPESFLPALVHSSGEQRRILEGAAAEAFEPAPGREAPARVRVLAIMSLAYSGTTWFTLVAGSHPQVLCLGAGDRVFEVVRGEVESPCLVHGSGCRFWPEFGATFDPKGSFFAQLAEYSGRSVFVINNPSRKAVEQYLLDPRVDLRVVRLVRDGRAALASAMRHHPERVESVYQSALAWLWRGTRNQERRLQSLPVEPLLLRYEDAVRDPDEALDRLSGHLGLTYDRSSLRYWEFEHHLLTGNAGTMETLRRLRGDERTHKVGDPYYDSLIDYLREHDGVPRLDDYWRSAYGPVDLAAYDWVAGEMYEALGYERPEVSEEARKAFEARHRPPASPAEAAKAVPPWRGEGGGGVEPGPLGGVLRRMRAAARSALGSRS